jgi:hypothetical protein
VLNRPRFSDLALGGELRDQRGATGGKDVILKSLLPLRLKTFAGSVTAVARVTDVSEPLIKRIARAG